MSEIEIRQQNNIYNQTQSRRNNDRDLTCLHRRRIGSITLYLKIDLVKDSDTLIHIVNKRRNKVRLSILTKM